MPPVHDYVLDNATGANFRSDLNNALAAIVSNNSSSSEPSTKYAYQWWADTNDGVLKIRNSANNAWVTLLQLDGTLTLEDGSASAPALGFRDDLNTGIFSSAADTVDVTCGGTTRGSFSSSGLTVTGNVTATTFVGNIDAVDGDFDGTMEADAITIGGTNLLTGAMEFSGDTIFSGTPRVSGTLSVDANIIHTGDTNTLIGFTTDAIKLNTGGTSRLDVSDSGVRFGSTGARVTQIEDNDSLGTSDTKLATQGNVKAYVDARVGTNITSLGTIAQDTVTFTSSKTQLAYVTWAITMNATDTKMTIEQVYILDDGIN